MPDFQMILEEIGPACDAVNAVTQLEDDMWAISCVDDQIHVLVEYDEAGEQVSLHAEHGTPAKENQLRTYEAMLIFNGASGDLGSVRLGLDGPGGQVTQECELPTFGLDLRGFQTALENFVTRAIAWRAVVGKGGVPAEGSDSEAGDVDPNVLRV